MKIEISDSELLEILKVTSLLASFANHQTDCHFNKVGHPEMDKCTCGLNLLLDREAKISVF